MTTAESILRDVAANGILLIPMGDRLDVDAPGNLLTDELIATLRAHKAELLAILTEPGRCPQCQRKMNLQDRAQDAWYCPACRKWSNGAGKPLPNLKKTSPLTREEHEARILIEDLKAAGCGFVIDDAELRLTFPPKIPTGLLARTENMGPELDRVMREEAERAWALT